MHTSRINALKFWGLMLSVILRLPFDANSFSGGLSLVRKREYRIPAIPFTKSVSYQHSLALQAQRLRSLDELGNIGENSTAGEPVKHNEIGHTLTDNKRVGTDLKIKVMPDSLVGERESRQRAISFAAAALFALTTTFSIVQDAQAAMTGGRMGGSFGGARARSYTSRSYAVPSRSYASPGVYNRGFTQGYSQGYLSSPVSAYGGVGLGYSPFYTPRPMIFAGPSLFGAGFFPLGFLGFFLLQAATSIARPRGPITPELIVQRETILDSSDGVTNVLGNGVTIAQISVALDVSNRKDPTNVLNYLNRLGQTAQTDTQKGLSKLVNQGK